VEATVSDIGLLMHTCAEAIRHVGEFVEILALVLWPKDVADPTQFAEWLRRAARVVPPRVRIVVVEPVEAPLLDELDGERVRRIVAELDMPGAIEELAAAAPSPTSDGGRFCAAFVAMSSALARADLDAARRHAELASTRAREAGHAELEAATSFALAGGLLGAGDVEGAIEQFAVSEQLAAQPALRVKAKLDLASALFGARAWSQAAREYVAAGALAGESGDRTTQVDALRMAAWSFERADALEDAWAAGTRGLEVAEGMQEEELERSTVPWLGELLRRLGGDGSLGDPASVNRRLVKLLGGGGRVE
jgi:hypothetical protein